MSHQFLINICSLFNKPNLIGSTKQLEGTVIPCRVPKILSDFTGLLFQVLGKFLGLRYPWFLIGKSSETSYVSLKTWSLLNETLGFLGWGGFSWCSGGMKKDTVNVLSQFGPAPGSTLVDTGAVISTFISEEKIK